MRPRCRHGLSLLLRAGQLVQRVEGRREVVGAADRTREVDQTIVHAITGGSEHTCEHTVVAGLVGAEGNEVQPVFPHGSVRYAAAEDLELLAADFDRDARDMRGRGLGSLCELHAIGLRSADHVLLLFHSELVERLEVMHPAHHENVTAPSPGSPGGTSATSAARWLGGFAVP